MNFKKALIILIPSLLAFAFILVISLFQVKEKPVENLETAKSIILLSKEKCDECEKQKEEWNKFKTESSINNLSFKEINVNSAEYLDFLEVHTVNGFPSIIILNEVGIPLYEHNGFHTYNELEAAVSVSIGEEVTNDEEGIEVEGVELSEELEGETNE